MAHSKAIFFGEHSVVYGYKGITIPLPQMSINVTLEKTNEIQQRDAIVNYIAEACNIEKTTKIIIDSSIPVGRGLGSSAALSVAIAEAKGLKNVREIANKCEKYIHGNPSGIDVNQVMSDTPLLFSKNDGATTLNFNLNSYLLIIDTGVIGITKDAVTRVKENYETNKKYIDELGSITEKVIPLLLNKNIEEIGKLMYHAHEQLKNIGVSDKANDDVVNICKENGAVGAKLTGGGDGGCCISLSKTLEHAENLQNILKKKGYLSWIVTV